MLYFIENFIPYMDKRVNDMLEIKNEVSSRSTGGNSQISISLPKEMHDKFRCYTKDRGISMEGLFKKWMSEYIIYCESEYKRIFAAKLEHRDGERAAHLRECRRINAKKQHEAKLAMKEAINPDDVEDDLPFSDTETYDCICSNPNCNEYLSDHGWRDEQDRIFCSEECLEEYGCEGDF